MIIGVPKEIKDGEHRVSLTPTGAEMLVAQGHRVVLETAAGLAAGMPDDAYRQAGAEILADIREATSRRAAPAGAESPRWTNLASHC